MFCLECGTKFQDDEEACSNCGMTLKAMRERIALAEEMITYADTTGPAPTEKLPLVSERTYFDAEGNVFRPEDEVDVAQIKKQLSESDIPQLGSDDPYVTMPIKRVISERGEVVTQVDSTQNVYLQAEEPKTPPLQYLGIALIVLGVAMLFGVGIFYFG